MERLGVWPMRTGTGKEKKHDGKKVGIRFNGRKGHILVAEDDPADAFFLKRAFNRAEIPITLHFVEDGDEAIRYSQGEGGFANRSLNPLPEIVLLDLKMPRRDGFEVLAWIRKQPLLSSVFVAIFSSSEQPGDLQRASALGANSYLVKPHSIQGLMDLVGSFKKQWLYNEDTGFASAA